MINFKIPAITTDQMREVDRLMVDVYGIRLLQMMENAGRNLAILAWQLFLGKDPVEKKV
jgi:NAD(P)H-hydrate epimerase